jgi:hypothetical protein
MGAVLLKGKDDDLQKHVNHRVELKGTLDTSSSSSGGDTAAANPSSPTGAAGAGAPAGGAGSSASSSMGGTLRVSSVKEISGSCSGGGNR